jgi:hypothetical protein
VEEHSEEDGSGSSESVENSSNETQEAPQHESADGPSESEGVEGESEGNPEAPEQAKHEGNLSHGDPRETGLASADDGDREPSQRDKVHSP